METAEGRPPIPSVSGSSPQQPGKDEVSAGADKNQQQGSEGSGADNTSSSGADGSDSRPSSRQRRSQRSSRGSLASHAFRRRAGASYSMNWTMDRLAQCVVMAMLIKNTQEVDALVAHCCSDSGAQSGDTPKLLKQLLAARVHQVNEMQNTLASAHSNADRQKMTTIISFLIYLRDVAARLSNNPSSLASTSTNRRGSLSHGPGPFAQPANTPSSGLSTSSRPGSSSRPRSQPQTASSTASTGVASAEDSLALSWEASSAVRCHVSDDGAVLVQFGTCVTSYSFEVVEPGQALCLSDLSERYWFGIMRASSLGLGAAAVCESRNSPVHTACTLSYLLGRPLHTVRCTELTDFQLLAQALKGMATTSSVLLLENIAQLPADVLSSLNDTVRLVMQAVRSSSTESIRIGRGPAVRVSTQPVCVVSHTSIHHEPLPIDLRQSFRTVATSLPHSTFVAEAVLAAHGLKTSKKLAAGLQRFVTLMSSLAPRPLPNQLPHPLACTWGMPFTQRVVNFVIASRPEPPAVSGLSEEEEVTNAVLALVGTRVTDPTDRALFLAVLRQCFDAAHRVDDVSLIMDTTHLTSIQRRVTRPLDDSAFNVLERLGLSSEGPLLASIEKLNSLINAHRVVYVVGTPGCGKSETIRGLSACLKKQGFDISAVSLPCGYLSAAQLMGGPTSTDIASGSSGSSGSSGAGNSKSGSSGGGSGSGGVSGGSSSGGGGGGGGGSGGGGSSGSTGGAGGDGGIGNGSSESGLIPRLLRDLHQSLASQASMDGAGRERDQLAARLRWLCLEGPIPEEVRVRLVQLEETGVLSLPDGTQVHVSPQVRVLVLTTPGNLDTSADTATADACGVLRLDGSSEVANACLAARLFSRVNSGPLAIKEQRALLRDFRVDLCLSCCS